MSDRVGAEMLPAPAHSNHAATALLIRLRVFVYGKARIKLVNLLCANVLFLYGHSFYDVPVIPALKSKFRIVFLLAVKLLALPNTSTLF